MAKLPTIIFINVITAVYLIFHPGDHLLGANALLARNQTAGLAVVRLLSGLIHSVSSSLVLAIWMGTMETRLEVWPLGERVALQMGRLAAGSLGLATLWSLWPSFRQVDAKLLLSRRTSPCYHCPKLCTSQRFDKVDKNAHSSVV